MKTNRKKTISQRQLIDAKLAPLLELRNINMPLDGWLKAIRGALGLTAAQLAKRMKLQTSDVLHLESREASKSATLSSLDRAAKALSCRLVWSIVPEKPYDSLSEIVEKRAKKLANRLVKDVDKTMKLEAQGISSEASRKQAEELAMELIRNGDSRIWEPMDGESND
jgi:predicted DNA-binding mobile mystery protein A